MKLKELKIQSDFKNLNGITVKFKSTISSCVLIGNNGSGKTSILEALSAIFEGLYYEKSAVEFAYYLCYEIEGQKVVIVRTLVGKITIKVNRENIDLVTLQAKYLPSRVICNYSGEDIRIKEQFYKKRYDDYIDSLKQGKMNDGPKLIFIDKNMWSIIFLIMLVCKDDVESFEHFLRDVIGYTSLDKIFLEFDSRSLSNWTANSVTYYLSLINNSIHEGVIDLETINPMGDSAHTLFMNWMGALPLIKKLSICYNNGVLSDFLSEGEKKLMTILFIQEAVADERSLILLDEPDSHIHVARKNELQKILCNTDNRESILTSHSPTLTSRYPDDAIIMLDRTDDGLATTISQEKKDIVAKLTDGIWSLQEQNIFLASNKDVLLVEGKTDEVFLSKALAYLQTKGNFCNMEFSYLPCGGASNVNEVMQRFEPKQNQLMICLFDSDKAGWEAINKIFGCDNNLYNFSNYGMAKKFGKIWFAPYPKPCSKKCTNFNIEDYFSRAIFLRYIMRFKSLDEIITKDAVKRSMESDCKNGTIKGKHYDKFEAVFTLIENIRKAEVENRTNI